VSGRAEARFAGGFGGRGRVRESTRMNRGLWACRLGRREVSCRMGRPKGVLIVMVSLGFVMK